MTPKKTGRNEECPCGSGSKFKRCCGSVTATSDSPIDTSPSDTPEVSYIYGRNMLMNRVHREADLVAEGFDELCRDHVADIEEIYSEIAVLLHKGSLDANRQDDHIRQVLFKVLSNALKSFTAAFSLLRTGWRLQPYQCMRNCMETLSVAIHLFLHSEDLPKFERDELASTSTLKSAKQFMEPFGRIYGQLSEDFVHIGRPFRYVQKGNLYTRDEKELWLSLGFQVPLLLLTYEVVELVFLDSAAIPRFWTRIGEREYKLTPTTDTIAWKKRLVERYAQYVPDTSIN